MISFVQTNYIYVSQVNRMSSARAKVRQDKLVQKGKEKSKHLEILGSTSARLANLQEPIR